MKNEGKSTMFVHEPSRICDKALWRLRIMAKPFTRYYLFPKPPSGGAV